MNNNIVTVKLSLWYLEEWKVVEYVDLSSEDGKQVNPNHSDLFPNEVVRKEALLEFWTNAKNNFAGMSFPIDEINITSDDSLVIAKFKGNIFLKDD